MVSISDQLSDEERAIMVFLKRYFEASGMPNALWILNESERIADVRAILNCYRDFFKSTERTAQSDGQLSRQKLSEMQWLPWHYDS